MMTKPPLANRQPLANIDDQQFDIKEEPKKIYLHTENMTPVSRQRAVKTKPSPRLSSN